MSGRFKTSQFFYSCFIIYIIDSFLNTVDNFSNKRGKGVEEKKKLRHCLFAPKSKLVILQICCKFHISLCSTFQKYANS